MTVPESSAMPNGVFISPTTVTSTTGPSGGGGADDADVPALTQQLDRVAKHAVEVTVFSQERKRITNATSLERAALYGFALAAALAALVLIGQAVVRLVAASGVDVATLRALGITRLQQ